jgi:hypothetical protein
MSLPPETKKKRKIVALKDTAVQMKDIDSSMRTHV